MKKKYRIIWSVAAIILFPLLGYLVTYILAIVAPADNTQSILYQGMFTLLFICILLAVPYGILKMLGHAAHVKNPQERELRMRDLPKDKEQLEHTQPQVD